MKATNAAGVVARGTRSQNQSRTGNSPTLAPSASMCPA
jgi:hypothetical protein